MKDVAAALSAENRRLRAEARRLEARLRAVESSRWWRLNPREAWRRHRPADEMPGEEPAVVSDAVPASHTETPELEGFRRDVLSRGTFTQSWGLGNAERWQPILASIEATAPRILEVGAFEGLTTCYLLWRFPDSTVTCVDTFAGGLDHAGTDTVPRDLERIFDGNVTLVDSSRVRKLVGDSKLVLPALLAEEAHFDFVYLDGSHLGLDVLVDAALAWQMLAAGGFLVFDDYVWAELGRDPLLRPGPAIDAFLKLVDGKHVRVLEGEQVAVRKLT